METSRVVKLRMHPAKKVLFWIGGTLLIFLIGYNIWAYGGRAKEKKTGWVDLPPAGRTRFREFDIGTDHGKGNILVIQPYLTPQNYSTAFNFLVSLKMYLRQAKRDSLIKPNTIVAFPEHVGTWLFAANEKESVYNKATISTATNLIFFSNFFGSVQTFFSERSGDQKMQNTILREKSGTMISVFDSTFASLAKEFGVTILAGSIILPNPGIDASGSLSTNPGELYNAYPIYSRTGRLVGPLIRTLAKSGFQVSNDSARSSVSHQITHTDPALEICICSNIESFGKQYAGLDSNMALIAYEGFSSSIADSKITPPVSASATPDKAELNDSSKGTSSRRSSTRSLIAFRFSGDMWEQFSDGNLKAAVRRGNRDSIIELGSAERRGRIVNYWIY